MKKVLIGLSWPYANGRLHIGGMASSLPADALARYHRMIGNDVSFITGSDCYGTPILVKAREEGITPTEIAEKYHALHSADFKRWGFSFDNYDKTISPRHNDFVKTFHTEMYESAKTSGLIYEKTAPQLYCDQCKSFLPDRYVEGTCPHCKHDAKGDSCDSCGKMLEPEELLTPRCILCNGTPKPREQTQMYIKLSALQDRIQKYFDERKDKWTHNAVGLTQRYLNEGLHDRAITRSIDWGVPVPIKGWDERRIYIWAENVLGYLSASEPEYLRGKDLLHYYVHGKDNIPFHAIILPALLMAHGGEYHLPDKIIASEYVNLNGQKISKSKGNLITAEELANTFDIDMIRYYFLRTVNDKRDSNFTIQDFINVVNGEVVNNFGNLVNRTLSFIKSKYDNKIPRTKKGNQIPTEYHELMVVGSTGKALSVVMDIVNAGNKYFADEKPWIEPEKSKEVIANVIDIISSTAYMLKPFMPTACEKIESWLSTDTLPEIDILFKRLEKETTING